MKSCPSFENVRIVVAGDLMLDQYWYGETRRISPEAPVPVVRVMNNEDRVGGAANVALNLAKLGAQASLCGIIGDDTAGIKLQQLLEQDHVQTNLVKSSNPTITKLRVLSQQQQLLRVDFENNVVEGHVLQELAKAVDQQLEQADALILSDYNKGCLHDVQTLIQLAKLKNKLILIDPKGSEFTRYTGASILTPNLGEFEAVVGPVTSQQDLETKARQLIADLQLDALLVTQGAQGMTLVHKKQTAFHIPAHAKEVFDVTGAGDTVIATLAAALAAGQTYKKAVRLANLAASIVVSKLGTASATREEIQRTLFSQNPRFGVLEQDELVAIVAEAQQSGEKIVMTNGCFDMLHAGHIMYLNEAKKRGDRLIVAVNSDESVRQLKGPGRPINSENQRMALLAALRDVDWVVKFNDETPQSLIAKILPDVLVKGGDYKVEEIAGHAEVLAAGGQVEVLGFVEGLSTTNTIARIKKSL